MKSIIVPPISTDSLSSKNEHGDVVVTPDKAANIAISTIGDFIQRNKGGLLEKIYFISKPADSVTHLAYKQALIEYSDHAKEKQKRDKALQARQKHKLDKKQQNKK